MLRYDVFTREGNSTPLQYSCLENPMDGGAWQATVHRVTKSQARLSHFIFFLGFPCGSDGDEFACNAGNLSLIPGLGRFPWRREWLPTPVFLPGKSHGQRSLVGYSSRGHKESDMTEQLKQGQFSVLSRMCSYVPKVLLLVYHDL